MLTENIVRLNGGRAQIVYRGGTGPALVYLHGLYGVAGDAPFIEALARRHSVTAPLAPGCKPSWLTLITENESRAVAKDSRDF